MAPNLQKKRVGLRKTSTSSALFVKNGLEFLNSKKLKDRRLLLKRLAVPTRAVWLL
jgi:hypothetical protein